MGYRRHGNADKGHKFQIGNKEGVTLDGKGVTVHNPTHFAFVENWRQKPGINADISDPTQIAKYTIANRDFEVLGTNAVTSDVTFRVGGGITLATHGASGDTTIIAPHLDTDQTALAVASFLSQKEPYFEALLETASAITAQKIYAGLKLTNVHTIATDDDQAYFRFDTASTLGAGSLHFISSRSGTDVDDILPITIAASTQYRLRIEIDANRCPRIWVNGVEYTNSLSASGRAALTTGISLKPYVGIAASAAAVKTVGLLPGYTIGRKL